MRWRTWILLIVLGVTVVSSGCCAARTVVARPDGGVVAIPNNTDSWPWYNREKALALIQQQCPNGYEIVREEEVVTGQVAQTNSNTNTSQTPAVVIGGANGTTTTRNGSSRSSDTFGSVAIPVGQTQQQTVQTTNYRDVTEWRITYRAK